MDTILSVEDGEWVSAWLSVCSGWGWKGDMLTGGENEDEGTCLPCRLFDVSSRQSLGLGGLECG